MAAKSGTTACDSGAIAAGDPPPSASRGRRARTDRQGRAMRHVLSFKAMPRTAQAGPELRAASPRFGHGIVIYVSSAVRDARCPQAPRVARAAGGAKTGRRRGGEWQCCTRSQRLCPTAVTAPWRAGDRFATAGRFARRRDAPPPLEACTLSGLRHNPSLGTHLASSTHDAARRAGGFRPATPPRTPVLRTRTSRRT